MYAFDDFVGLLLPIFDPMNMFVIGLSGKINRPTDCSKWFIILISSFNH